MYRFIYRIVNNKILTTLCSILLIVGIIANIIPYFFSDIVWSTEYSNQIMLGYAALGIFFLIFSNKRLMLISLFCAGFLALFLKTTTNSKIKMVSRNNLPEVNLLLCNFNELSDSSDKIFSHLKNLDENVLICQEASIGWKQKLQINLSQSFKQQVVINGTQSNNILIFSNLNISKKDTYDFNGVPILHLIIGKDPYKVSLYSLCLADRKGNSDQYVTFNIIDKLSEVIRKDTLPKIVVGNFNLVMWSAKLQEFTKMNSLENSRNGYYPNIYQGASGFFKRPVSHIFYSKELECFLFERIRQGGDIVGIQSNIQFSHKM